MIQFYWGLVRVRLLEFALLMFVGIGAARTHTSAGKIFMAVVLFVWLVDIMVRLRGIRAMKAVVGNPLYFLHLVKEAGGGNPNEAAENRALIYVGWGSIAMNTLGILAVLGTATL